METKSDGAGKSPGDTKQKTRRVQMDLPNRSYDRIDRLKKLTEATSYAEVIKNAIRLYEFLIDEEAEGSKFFLEKDGERTNIILFSSQP